MKRAKAKKLVSPREWSGGSSPTTDRRIYISPAKLGELTQCKSELREVTEKAKYSELQLAKLQVENTRLDRERISLFTELQSRNSEFPSGSSRYFKLPTGRVFDCRKRVSNVNVLLANHNQLIVGLVIPDSIKKRTSKNIRKIIHNLDRISDVLINEVIDHEEKHLGTHSREQYEDSISKMKRYSLTLNEKISRLEENAELKHLLHEKDEKIRLLHEEKIILHSHVQALQSTVTEQSSVLEYLRASKENPSLIESKNPYVESDCQPYILEEKHLQEEISVLDLELKDLQKSLQNTLFSH